MVLPMMFFDLLPTPPCRCLDTSKWLYRVSWGPENFKCREGVIERFTRTGFIGSVANHPSNRSCELTDGNHTSSK